MSGGGRARAASGYRSMPSRLSQRDTPAASMLVSRRVPGFQSPVLVREERSRALGPTPEENDVQNGTTTLPEKSFFRTKSPRTQEASPHQMG